MRRLQSFLYSVALGFALFICFPSVSKAASEIEKPTITRVNENTGYKLYFYDGANLIGDDEVNEVIDKMYPVTEYGDVGFYTTDENTETGGEYFYNDVQYNWFGNDSSVILFIDMEDRYIWIQNYGSIKKSVSNSMAESITDNAYLLAGNEQYKECALQSFEQIYKVANGERIARPMKVICNVLLSLILSFLILFIIIKSTVKLPRTDINEWQKYLKYSVSYEKNNSKLVKTRKVSTGGGSGSSGSSGGYSGGGGFSGGGGHVGGGGGHHF